MIRAARAEDATAIAAIWNHVIRDGAITFTTKEKTQAEIEALIAAAPVLVAETGGTVTGFAKYGAFRAGPGYADAAEHTILLAPGAQGQGLGRALMAALQARAQTDGIVHLIAGISGSNARAVAFHAALGFAKVGHLPGVGRKRGSRHDLVLMMKKLDAPR